MLPLEGIIRMMPLDSRMINASFYCPGLPYLGVETLITMASKLMMHFGCNTATGNFLLTSYSYLILEIGLSSQPFQMSYDRFSFLATHSWMKMLQEKLDKFGIVVQTTESSFQFPKRGDRFLMIAFMEKGHNGKTLKRLNRVRQHQQIVFLSDILSTSGLRIDPTIYHQRGEVTPIPQ